MNSAEPSEMQSTPPSAPTAGQMLRAAREARGMHLAQLSVNLKVSVRQLEALEADRYEVFKGAAFMRALAQSVSRQLGIDPKPVLQALPKGDAPKALEPAALQASPPTVVSSARPWFRIGVPRQVLALALPMLLALVVLIWWPMGRQEAPRLPVAEEAPQSAVPMGQASDPVEIAIPVVPAQVAVPASVAQPMVAPQPVAQPVAQQAASAAVIVRPAAVPVVLPAPVASAALAAPAAAASQKERAVASTESSLVIKASANVWVSVRDKQGQMALRRQVKAGETIKLDVAAPVFVYAGRAEATALTWRGQPVDLAPHTQNNEVRLLIKP
jgi:cytoskeleton protein RodZ